MHRSMRIVMACGFAAAVFAAAVMEFTRLKSGRPPGGESPPTSDAPRYDCPEDKPPRERQAQSSGMLDVTAEIGLDFTHAVGPLGTYFMPESIGAGAAFLDYDNDGRLDIFLVNSGRSPQAAGDFPPTLLTTNRLYRQTESHRFVDVTNAAGLAETGYGAGVAAGDIDNDGLPDLFIANYGQDRLFRNEGNGSFRDITTESGFHDADWGACAAMVDYDRDGWLDIVVVNYTADPVYHHSVACGFHKGTVSYCGPRKFQPTIDRLYHNEGMSGTGNEPGMVHFRDVTEESGLSRSATYGFGVIAADLTNDGWPDLFIANDSDPNRLWVNQQNGRFEEEAAVRGLAVNADGIAEAGMGIAIGDVNHDLFPDLCISHLTNETSTLYLNSADGYFHDRTTGSGIDRASRSHTGWGIALVDLDDDGLLDLPLVNGLVVPCHSGFPYHGEDQFQKRTDVILDSAQFWKTYADENVLLFGRANGTFAAAENVGADFCGAVASGRGLACADWDNDGDMDLLVTNCGTSARLYRNDLPSHGNWLTVRACCAQSRRDALGARVLIRHGTTQHLQVIAPQSGYLCSHDARAHFGLGTAESVDEIIVLWPDGPVDSAAEKFPGSSANQFITVERGRGIPIKESSK